MEVIIEGIIFFKFLFIKVELITLKVLVGLKVLCLYFGAKREQNYRKPYWLTAQ